MRDPVAPVCTPALMNVERAATGWGAVAVPLLRGVDGRQLIRRETRKGSTGGYNVTPRSSFT